MIDDQFVALQELPEKLPRRRGKKVSFSTVYRWATKGCRGRILKTWRLGGVLYTSRAAVEEFFFYGGSPTEGSEPGMGIEAAEALLRAEGI